MPDLVPALRAAVTADFAGRRCFSESTYRRHFPTGCTFRDALAMVPYLHVLSITHCYASPLLQARLGSTYGYDIKNYQAVHPAIGTAADDEAFCQALQAHGMGRCWTSCPTRWA